MPIILLIEDDDAVRESLTSALVDVHDATVDAVASISAARETFDVTRHEIVISDLELPDGSGRTFAAAVKAVHPHVTVALMSGSFTARDTPRIQAQDGGHGADRRACRVAQRSRRGLTRNTHRWFHRRSAGGRPLTVRVRRHPRLDQDGGRSGLGVPANTCDAGFAGDGSGLVAGLP